jgi:hypothetical protein
MTKGSNLNVNVNGKRKTPTVVNMFAGPGVGKSTTAAAVFALLKMHDVECEFVSEYAKDLVWEERARTFENQLYLFAKQHHRQWRLRDKVDLIITDTSILLNNIYGKVYDRYGSDLIYDYVLEEFHKFNNINFVIERITPYNEVGRNETKEQAESIDNYIKEYLSDNDILYFPIYGNAEGINTAVSTVFNHIGGVRKYKIVYAPPEVIVL